MNALLLWFLCAVATAAWGPRVLRALMLRGVDPRILLVSWLAVVVGTLAGLVIPAVVAVLPEHGGVSALATAAHTCWLLLHGDAPIWIEVSFAALGAIVILLCISRWPMYLRRAALEHHRIHKQHLELARILDGSRSLKRGAVLRVPMSTPLAYSVAGRPALVVTSDGLWKSLEPDEVSAVLAHERAHIHGRHHLFVLIAESLAFTLRFLPLMAQSPSLVRSLVELEADTHAVRVTDEKCVQRVLRRLQPHEVPPNSLGMAPNHRDFDLRIQRLASGRASNSVHLKMVHGVAAFGGTLTLTALPALALATEILLASCDLV